MADPDTPDPVTGLLPPRGTPGSGPDFDGIFDYAAQWIKLGDALWEYYYALGEGATDLQWVGGPGGAHSQMIDSLHPLAKLMIDPTNEDLFAQASDVITGRTNVPSACRMLWNIGESINWYAVNLKKERQKEKAQELKDLFLGLFMFLLAIISFIPVLGVVLEIMTVLSQILTFVVRLFDGAEWLEELAGFIGGVADTAAGTIVQDKVFNKLAGDIVGIDPDDSWKQLGIELGEVFALGGLASGPRRGPKELDNPGDIHLPNAEAENLGNIPKSNGFNPNELKPSNPDSLPKLSPDPGLFNPPRTSITKEDASITTGEETILGGDLGSNDPLTVGGSREPFGPPSNAEPTRVVTGRPDDGTPELGPLTPGPGGPSRSGGRGSVVEPPPEQLVRSGGGRADLAGGGAPAPRVGGRGPAGEQSDAPPGGSDPAVSARPQDARPAAADAGGRALDRVPNGATTERSAVNDGGVSARPLNDDAGNASTPVSRSPGTRGPAETEGAARPLTSAGPPERPGTGRGEGSDGDGPRPGSASRPEGPARSDIAPGDFASRGPDAPTPTRQVFRTHEYTGKRDLVTLTKKPDNSFPGAGNRLVPSADSEKSASREPLETSKGSAEEPGVGGEASARGVYSYHEIDRTTGKASPTEIRPDEVVTGVKHGLGKDPANQDEHFAVYDPRGNQWQIRSVGPPPKPLNAAHDQQPLSTPVRAGDAAPTKIQVLRRNGDGSVDLLTFDKRPAVFAGRESNGVKFRALGRADGGAWKAEPLKPSPGENEVGGRPLLSPDAEGGVAGRETAASSGAPHSGDWQEVGLLGKPEVNQLTPPTREHLQDGQSADAGPQHSVLVWDQNSRQFVPVRSASGKRLPPEVPAPVPFRAVEGSEGLSAVPVKSDPIVALEVHPDGEVESFTFSLSGADLPNVHLHPDGSLRHEMPDDFSASKFSYDPHTGRLSYQEDVVSAETGVRGPHGGPDGQGGPPDSHSGGNGLQMRKGLPESSRTITPLAKRTITFSKVESPAKGEEPKTTDRGNTDGPPSSEGPAGSVPHDDHAADGSLAAGGRVASSDGSRTEVQPWQRRELHAQRADERTKAAKQSSSGVRGSDETAEGRSDPAVDLPERQQPAPANGAKPWERTRDHTISNARLERGGGTRLGGPDLRPGTEVRTRRAIVFSKDGGSADGPPRSSVETPNVEPPRTSVSEPHASGEDPAGPRAHDDIAAGGPRTADGQPAPSIRSPTTIRPQQHRSEVTAQLAENRRIAEGTRRVPANDTTPRSSPQKGRSTTAVGPNADIPTPAEPKNPSGAPTVKPAADAASAPGTQVPERPGPTVNQTPQASHLSLATPHGRLGDGTEVYFVHHRDGATSVTDGDEPPIVEVRLRAHTSGPYAPSFETRYTVQRLTPRPELSAPQRAADDALRDDLYANFSVFQGERSAPGHSTPSRPETWEDPDGWLRETDGSPVFFLDRLDDAAHDLALGSDGRFVVTRGHQLPVAHRRDPEAPVVGLRVQVGADASGRRLWETFELGRPALVLRGAPQLRSSRPDVEAPPTGPPPDLLAGPYGPAPARASLTSVRPDADSPPAVPHELPAIPDGRLGSAPVMFAYHPDAASGRLGSQLIGMHVQVGTADDGQTLLWETLRVEPLDTPSPEVPGNSPFDDGLSALPAETSAPPQPWTNFDQPSHGTLPDGSPVFFVGRRDDGGFATLDGEPPVRGVRVQVGTTAQGARMWRILQVRPWSPDAALIRPGTVGMSDRPAVNPPEAQPAEKAAWPDAEGYFLPAAGSLEPPAREAAPVSEPRAPYRQRKLRKAPPDTAAAQVPPRVLRKSQSGAVLPPGPRRLSVGRTLGAGPAAVRVRVQGAAAVSTARVRLGAVLRFLGFPPGGFATSTVRAEQRARAGTAAKLRKKREVRQRPATTSAVRPAEVQPPDVAPTVPGDAGAPVNSAPNTAARASSVDSAEPARPGAIQAPRPATTEGDSRPSRTTPAVGGPEVSEILSPPHGVEVDAAAIIRYRGVDISVDPAPYYYLANGAAYLSEADLKRRKAVRIGRNHLTLTVPASNGGSAPQLNGDALLSTVASLAERLKAIPTGGSSVSEVLPPEEGFTYLNDWIAGARLHRPPTVTYRKAERVGAWREAGREQARPEGAGLGVDGLNFRFRARLPVDSLYAVFKLIAGEEYLPLGRMRELTLDAVTFGETVAALYAKIPIDMVQLTAGIDMPVAEIASFAALLYTQIAANFEAIVRLDTAVRDHTPVLALNSLSILRSGFRGEVLSHFKRHREQIIRQLRETYLESRGDFFTRYEKLPDPVRRAIDERNPLLLPLANGGGTIGDYLNNAFSDRPDLMIDQTVGVGAASTLDRPDFNQSVPLADLEFQYVGLGDPTNGGVSGEPLSSSSVVRQAVTDLEQWTNGALQDSNDRAQPSGLAAWNLYQVMHRDSSIHGLVMALDRARDMDPSRHHFEKPPLGTAAHADVINSIAQLVRYSGAGPAEPYRHRILATVDRLIDEIEPVRNRGQGETREVLGFLRAARAPLARWHVPRPNVARDLTMPAIRTPAGQQILAELVEDVVQAVRKSGQISLHIESGGVGSIGQGLMSTARAFYRSRIGRWQSSAVRNALEPMINRRMAELGLPRVKVHLHRRRLGKSIAPGLANSAGSPDVLRVWHVPLSSTTRARIDFPAGNADINPIDREVMTKFAESVTLAIAERGQPLEIQFEADGVGADGSLDRPAIANDTAPATAVRDLLIPTVRADLDHRGLSPDLVTVHFHRRALPTASIPGHDEQDGDRRTVLLRQMAPPSLHRQLSPQEQSAVNEVGRRLTASGHPTAPARIVAAIDQRQPVQPAETSLDQLRRIFDLVLSGQGIQSRDGIQTNRGLDGDLESDRAQPAAARPGPEQRSVRVQTSARVLDPPAKTHVRITRRLGRPSSTDRTVRTAYLAPSTAVEPDGAVLPRVRLLMRADDGRWIADGARVLLTRLPGASGGLALLSAAESGSIGDGHLFAAERSVRILVHPAGPENLVRVPVRDAADVDRDVVLNSSQLAWLVAVELAIDAGKVIVGESPADLADNDLTSLLGEVSVALGSSVAGGLPAGLVHELAVALRLDVLAAQSDVLASVEAPRGRLLTLSGESWLAFTADGSVRGMVNDGAGESTDEEVLLLAAELIREGNTEQAKQELSALRLSPSEKVAWIDRYCALSQMLSADRQAAFTEAMEVLAGCG